MKIDSENEVTWMEKVISRQAWKLRTTYKKCKYNSPTTHSCSLLYPVNGIRDDYSREQIEKQIRISYCDTTEKQISAHTGQIFTALNRVKLNDLVIIPTDKGRFFTFGLISDTPKISLDGEIKFRFCMQREGVPISTFNQDLRYSFMAIMKICEVRRNSAFDRLLEISNGSDDPGFL